MSSNEQPVAMSAAVMAATIAGLQAERAAMAANMVAQIFAALMPLPAAPNGTSDPGTDVPNLILYQTALAQYAKRDEQVRTLGNLIVKLVG